MKWGKLLAVVLVAGTFAYAGVAKARDPQKFAEAIAAYQILSYPTSAGAAMVLPCVEIVAAIALLIPRTRQSAALLIAASLVIFTTAATAAKIRGLDIDCACFGAGSTSIQNSYWVLLLRNTALLAATLFGAFWSRRRLFAEVQWEPVLKSAMILFASSAVAGAATVLVHPQPPQLVPIPPAMTENAPPITRANIDEASRMPPPPIVTLQQAQSSKVAVWLDARPEHMYSTAHLPGAENITVRNFDEVAARLKKEGKAFQKVVVYCAPGCPASKIVANMMIKQGFKDVSIVGGGWDPVKGSMQ